MLILSSATTILCSLLSAVTARPAHDALYPRTYGGPNEGVEAIGSIGAANANTIAGIFVFSLVIIWI